MSDMHAHSIQYFVIIAKQKKKDKFINLLVDYGAKQIDTVYGRGSMSPSALAAAFGLDAEEGRAVISCLIKSEKAKELIDVLYNDYRFNKPNTGIAFSIPVEGLSF